MKMNGLIKAKFLNCGGERSDGCVLGLLFRYLAFGGRG